MPIYSLIRGSSEVRAFYFFGAPPSVTSEVPPLSLKYNLADLKTENLRACSEFPEILNLDLIHN